MYLAMAMVMDLYLPRIVGWHIDKLTTTNLVSKAMTKAYNLQQPPKNLVFHFYRGSQYICKHYRKSLANYCVRSSMGTWALVGIMMSLKGSLEALNMTSY
ncbi:hypothetical protein [Shewanella maritima]|uniref:hypothetical protein n=1 Tax=Shewanella maritima TaxID=2520507 RepID=UPI0037363ADC